LAGHGEAGRTLYLRLIGVTRYSVFSVYVTRDYAATYWEWLIGAAEAFGGLVKEVG
jgi:hypothetical protein